jgi:hypothetical protein
MMIVRGLSARSRERERERTTRLKQAGSESSDLLTVNQTSGPSARRAVFSRAKEQTNSEKSETDEGGFADRDKVQLLNVVRAERVELLLLLLWCCCCCCCVAGGDGDDGAVMAMDG